MFYPKITEIIKRKYSRKEESGILEESKTEIELELFMTNVKKIKK